jgi:hypothetical protein
MGEKSTTASAVHHDEGQGSIYSRLEGQLLEEVYTGGHRVAGVERRPGAMLSV